MRDGLKRRAPAARLRGVWRELIAALVVLTAWLARATEGEPDRIVRYENDRLTVRLAKAPVGEVLDEIGRVSGAEIRGQANAREVSAEFESVPLPDALHRLLGNQNFTLKYGDKDRPVAIELLGGPTGAPPTVTPQVWSRPGAMALNVRAPDTATGVELAVPVEPSPSSPRKSSPQQYPWPTGVQPQVWTRPAARSLQCRAVATLMGTVLQS